MYILEITLKGSPIALSVQKKEESDAKAAYSQVTEAMKSANSVTLELTCEHQGGKTVCVLASEISSVQLSEKSGTSASSGKPPGFFALT
ncbi:MAG: hypothetical protein VKL39_23415 [Leptolyngbyaceae bacterium]|nr:hypothetical protein [Leptolyngbyaceae bacterium]